MRKKRDLNRILYLPINERLYTTEEVADRLCISPGTLRNKRMKDAVFRASYKLSNEARYSESDLRRIIDSIYSIPD